MTIAEATAEFRAAASAKGDFRADSTVRYETVNAMLLNEFLKEHCTVQELKKEVAALAAGLQKVSAQLAAASPSRGGLEANGQAQQVVNNNQ